LLRAIEDALRQELDIRWSDGLAVFAAQGEVVLSQRLAEAPRSPLARVAPLSHVLPLLAQRGEGRGTEAIEAEVSRLVELKSSEHGSCARSPSSRASSTRTG
jgi:hypothetical protein